MNFEHPRVTAIRLGVAGRTTEDLGPVVGQPLDMLRIAGVGERVVQLRILKAALVGGCGQGKEGLVAAGEFEHRWPGHEQQFRAFALVQLRTGYDK
jgi:hypothetical protein